MLLSQKSGSAVQQRMPKPSHYEGSLQGSRKYLHFERQSSNALSVDFHNSSQISQAFQQPHTKEERKQLRSIVNSYFVAEEGKGHLNDSTDHISEIGCNIDETRRIFKGRMKSSLPELDTIYTANRRSDTQSSLALKEMVQSRHNLF